MHTLSPGDHIRVRRGVYYHHGILVDNNAVVHFTDVRNRKASASVRQCTLLQFAHGGTVEKVRYRECLPARVVVQRATSNIGRAGYNIFQNNCEHFARWCKVGEHTSEQVRRAGAGTAWMSASWGAAALGLQSLPLLAAPKLVGAAQTMSALRSAGSALGGGAQTGVALITILPTVAATTAVRAMYVDDPRMAEDERAARRTARTAGTIGALGGGVVSLAALGSKGSLGAPGLTTMLKLVGRGHMATGLATLIGAPALLAFLAGLVMYGLAKRKSQIAALPPAGGL